MQNEELIALLERFNRGDHTAKVRLTELLLLDVKKIAKNVLRRYKRGSLMQTTVLINEAVMRVFSGKNLLPTYQAKLLAYFKVAMKNIVLTYLRNAKNERPQIFRISDDEMAQIVCQDNHQDEKLDLEFALDALAAEHSFEHEVVEDKVFLDLTLKEIARKHDTTIWAARKAWSFGQAYLWCKINGNNGHDKTKQSNPHFVSCSSRSPSQRPARVSQNCLRR